MALSKGHDEIIGSLSDMAGIDFRRVFETMPERSLIVSADNPRFTILAASDLYLELVNLLREDIIGRGLFEIFPDSPYETVTREQFQLRNALDIVLRHHKSHTLSAYRYDLPDRSTPDEAFERYWSPTLTPFFDDEGKPWAVMFSIEEATDFVLRERYRRKNLLPHVDRGRAQRKVLLVEPNPCLRANLSSTFATYWEVRGVSSAAEAFDSLETFAPDVILTATNLPDAEGRLFIAALKARREVSVLARVAHTDGRQYQEAFEAGADDVIGGPATMREFLARVQTLFAEADLREATGESVRRQYHELFMQAPIAISLMEGPDRIFTLSNPAHDEMVGHRALLGKPLREAFEEDHLQPLFDHLDDVYETGQPYFATEVPIMTHFNDVTRYVTFAYLPFQNPADGTRGVTSFAYDVTEQVEMRRAVERENERKDVFLATLGHELRNPLAPIAHANALLRMGARELAPEKIQWATETIARQVEQLERHVNDLLDVARINQGRVGINRGPVELQQILDSALEAAGPKIEERGQHLSVSTPHRRYVVNLDAARIVQVVTNLLDNASKYTAVGGDIALKAKLHTEADSSRLIIEVRDDGEGIEPAFLPHLFDLFSQEDVTVDRARGGLGLGLALVKGIVEKHAGEVRAHSAGRGKGSTFVVELPVEIAPGPFAAKPPARNQLSRAKVLVVDDIADVADALRRLLEMMGATVTIATCGHEALERLTEVEPTHVLLDIGLPDIDGYEVARRIRALPLGRPLSLIALTGYGLPEDARRAAEAGFDHHLTKPAKIDKLIELIGESSTSL